MNVIHLLHNLKDKMIDGFVYFTPGIVLYKLSEAFPRLLRNLKIRGRVEDYIFFKESPYVIEGIHTYEVCFPTL